MSETDKAPPPRRTIAVTIAGVLFLLPAAICALVAIIAAEGHLRNAYAVGVGWVLAAVFGYAGLATIRRWRGWRIWAGTLAWGLIVFVVLKLFAPPPPPGTDRSFDLVADLIVIAIAVLVLVAKRRERRPDIAAVFDS